MPLTNPHRPPTFVPDHRIPIDATQQQAIEPVYVAECTRCGGSHDKVYLYPFKSPVEISDEPPYTHWGWCPKSLAPILARWT